MNKLSQGVAARIFQIADCPYRARLSEMGVLPGEQIMILHKAPLSGPIAVKIGNQMLALRREEARLITVEYEP